MRFFYFVYALLNIIKINDIKKSGGTFFKTIYNICE